MLKANEMQVGGDHYRSSMQHWDVVSKWNVPYLEGCASKYVSRWRKKNGLQDLEKAVHFATKLKEVVMQDEGNYRSAVVPFHVIEKFVIANDLEMQERHVLQMLWGWRDVGDIDHAIIGISALIREAKRVQEKRRDD